jgi:hypothetical protein
VAPVKKKPRGPRVRLTHFEIRRGNILRLRIAINDDAIAEVGDELGALFRKIAPGAVSTSTVSNAVASGAIEVVLSEPPSEIIIMPQHTDDDGYHAALRARLAELFGSLCDASLADALEVAREERARRVDGGN